MKHGADQLRDWMQRQGMNQRETADRLGWDESQMSHVLAKRRNIGLQTAILIHRLTGIPTEAWASSALDEMEVAAPVAGRKRK